MLEETARKTFEQGLGGGDLPTFDISISEIEAGIPAYKLFHMVGLCDSLGAAKRLIQGKGGKVNNKQIDNEHAIIDVNFIEDGEIKLSSGQKKHLLVKVLKN